MSNELGAKEIILQSRIIHPGWTAQEHLEWMQWEGHDILLPGSGQAAHLSFIAQALEDIQKAMDEAAALARTKRIRPRRNPNAGPRQYLPYVEGGPCQYCGEPRDDEMGEFWDETLNDGKGDSVVLHAQCGIGLGLGIA